MTWVRRSRLTRLVTISPWVWLALIAVGLLLAQLWSPVEKVLGASARIVYLHGAWIWAAMLTISASALLGLLALVVRKPALPGWSRAAGRAGLLLWAASLPLSLYLMQASWNGLFLLEPRWRIPLTFVITGLLMQGGLSFFPARWASPANLAFGAAFWVAMQQAGDVLHPDSPIITSEDASIKLFFFGLVVLLTALAWQVTRLFHRLEPDPAA